MHRCQPPCQPLPLRMPYARSVTVLPTSDDRLPPPTTHVPTVGSLALGRPPHPFRPQQHRCARLSCHIGRLGNRCDTTELPIGDRERVDDVGERDGRLGT